MKSKEVSYLLREVEKSLTTNERDIYNKVFDLNTLKSFLENNNLENTYNNLLKFKFIILFKITKMSINNCL